MTKLDELRPAEGATSKSKRVGRGRSSGHGKTSCRGHNGEGQRSGASAKRGFEGGQMPGFRQMPKLKGFKNRFAIACAEINIRDLEALKLEEVSLGKLLELKKVHPSAEKLRVLGNGEISKAITVKANYFTPQAKEKLEKAGGKVELV